MTTKVAFVAVLFLTIFILANAQHRQCRFSSGDKFSLEKYEKLSGSEMRCWMRSRYSRGGRFIYSRGDMMRDLAKPLNFVMEQLASPLDMMTGKYPNTTECRWIFVNKERKSKRFALDFVKFCLEDEEKEACSKDYVEVRYLKPNCNIKSIKFCGCNLTKLPNLRFRASAIEIRFLSDENKAFNGFVANLMRLGEMKTYMDQDAMDDAMTGELKCSKTADYSKYCSMENATEVYKPKVMIVTRMSVHNETHMLMKVTTSRLMQSMRMFNRYKGNCCIFDSNFAQTMKESRTMMMMTMTEQIIWPEPGTSPPEALGG